MIKTINLRKLIPCILLPLFISILAKLFSSNAKDVYANLLKPPASPPALIFPFVWTLLYILIGVSCYLAQDSTNCDQKKFRQSYLILLCLNLIYPIIFFSLKWYTFSVVIIILMIASAIITIYNFYNCDKNAGYLMIPYLIWIIYAAYLNIGIVALN